MPASLEELVKVRSQLALGLLEHFGSVMRAPDEVHNLPAYAGGRAPTKVYVEPDALERGEEHEEPPAGTVARERGHRGERRLAWTTALKRLESEQRRRAVVLGLPGQGKRLLLLMSGKRLAAEAREAFADQRVAAGEVRLPIVVSIHQLTARDTPSGLPPQEALRHALEATLREQGCPELVAEYLSAHAHEERCWMLLHGLDEAADQQALSVFLAALKEWRCRLVITSRSSGYVNRQLPFEVVEYRLAPFSLPQARAFVEKWFPDTRRRRMLHLFSGYPSVRQLCGNPFLLTLACSVMERQSLSSGITRTQLYGRVVRDVLGLVADGAFVDEQRAEEWLPLLSEIGLRSVENVAWRSAIPIAELLDLMAESERRPTVSGLTAAQAANLTPWQQAHYLLEELEQKRLLVPTTPRRPAYEFRQRAIVEYLAAYALARMEDRQRVLSLVDKMAWDPQWEQVVLFLAGELREPKPLLEMLRNHREDDIYRHRLALAARALAELPAETRARHERMVGQIATEAFRVWFNALKKGLERTVSHFDHAISALAQVNAPVSGTLFLERLGQLLSDREHTVQACAAEAVRRLGPAAATPEVQARLQQMLADTATHPGVCERVAEALARLLAETDAAELSKWLRTQMSDAADPGVRAGAVRALAGLGAAGLTPRLVGGLLKLLREPAPDLQGAAACALGALGRGALSRPEASNQLETLRTRIAELLRNGDDDARKGAAHAIAELGRVATSAEVIEELDHALRPTNSPDLLYWAASAAGCAGHEAAEKLAPPLVKLLEHGDDLVKAAAARALGDLGPAGIPPEVIPRLHVLFSHDAPVVRWWAARAVGAIGAASGQDVAGKLLGELREVLAGKSVDVVTLASSLRALGRLASGPGDWDARTIFNQVAAFLGDGDADARAAAAEAIGRIGARRSELWPDQRFRQGLSQLPNLVRHADPIVKHSAAQAIGRLMSHGFRFFRKRGGGLGVRRVEQLASPRISEPSSDRGGKETRHGRHA